MSKLTLIRLCFWLYLVRTVVSEDDLSLKVGGELVLTPDKSTVPYPITSILWKHGKNKVAEWDKDFGGLDIYAAFINRTTLDQTTGELRISGLKKTDSGVYSVEFNSKLLDKTYTLSVIKPVPKPTITSSCNPDKTSCTLTCEGDTTDAEPVTYSWKVGEGAWEVIGKQLIVSKSDTGKPTNSYKYICKLKNSVSGEVSEVFGSEPVPKPTITYTCNSNKTSCILTCEGNTTGAEPVTYSWKVGEGAWEVIGKQLIVSKSDTGKSTNSYKYICKMKNSAGEGEVSEPVGEVFGSEPSEVGVVVVGVVVTIVALVIVIIGFLVRKKITGYPQDTRIDFLRKYCGGMFAKGNDVVQPEQGKGNANKAEKRQGNEDDVSLKVGGELVLTPDKSTVPDSITSILWKHGNCYVADWDKELGGLGICGAFKGRTTLNQTTGELRISGLKKTDSGVYSVEFNRKLLDKTYKLSVIRGDDKTKTNGSAAPGGDLNAAEKGEANREGSVLLNEDTVKYNNGEAPAEENSAL
ncbi:uncharacterized protein LOC115196278 isoform X3 [Salmo trutta]|uniref:uncharacterized protein LOC115196278 isoform X3 n=1 Tax=Salmo trutta TaxID=8032 RepID=UPI00113249EA|nr:uncharacterized protein LOC115196278 isoform X3 [Salmo trutta]